MTLPQINRTPNSAGVSRDAPRTADFATRHIGPTPRDVEAMLRVIGVNSVAELMSQTIPPGIRLDRPLRLGSALSGTEALAQLRAMAAKNEVMTSLIGMGYHGTIMPPVIQRNIFENPAWYTAYTPYSLKSAKGVWKPS